MVELIEERTEISRARKPFGLCEPRGQARAVDVPHSANSCSEAHELLLQWPQQFLIACCVSV